MKTFFKSILAVAVCASLFAACSKDDTVSDPSNGRKVTMTVTASSELESASGSRTTYDPLTGKISWNETGEYLQVFETAASKTTYANSQEGTVSDGTAKFAVSFPENTNTPLVYNAVYPASAWITVQQYGYYQHESRHTHISTADRYELRFERGPADRQIDLAGESADRTANEFRPCRCHR
jgi:hypothetical protein